MRSKLVLEPELKPLNTGGWVLFSDIVDEAMRKLGDERWSRNDISVPGLSGLSVGAGGAVWCALLTR